MAIYQTKFIECRKIAEKTLEVSIKRPQDFFFEAGQYLQLGIEKLSYPDCKGSSRVLSIASAPTNKTILQFIFRDTGSGFKKTLKELNNGDKIKIEGPHGFYTSPKKSYSSIIFVAGGIGITPFLSRIREKFESKTDFSYPVKLIYANRNSECATCLKELINYEKFLKNFSLKSTFNRINEEFILENIKDFLKCKWYIAGPPAMVDSIRSLLYKLKINQEKIHFEEFSGY